MEYTAVGPVRAGGYQSGARQADVEFDAEMVRDTFCASAFPAPRSGTSRSRGFFLSVGRALKGPVNRSKQ